MAKPDASTERTFAAVVLGWDGMLPAGTRALRRLGRLIEGLCVHCVEVVVVGAPDVQEVDRSLGARPTGPGHLHVCVGRRPEVFRITASGPHLLRRPATATGCGPDDPAAGGVRHEDVGTEHAVRWALEHLETRGVVPGLVLLVGEGLGRVDGAQHPAGSVSVGSTLAEQLRRLRSGAMPQLDEDPRWTVQPRTVGRRARQSLFTLGAAGFGTRGAAAEEGPAQGAGVLAAGVYDGSGEEEHLIPAPVWTVLDTSALHPDGSGDRMALDLRSGVLARRPDPDGGIASVCFASQARPGVVVLRAAAPGLRGGRPLVVPEGVPTSSGREDGLWWAGTAGAHGGVTVVADQRVRDGHVDRVAAYVARPPRAVARALAARTVRRAIAGGFGPLLAEQRERWAERWADCHVAIPDDPDAELALRFALFHLLGAADSQGEAAVGARGLSGPGYRGHVFWDADVFVLPALAAVRPESARAMLEYRLRRLGAARARAAGEGGVGARFPWESARDGTDVTPAWAPDLVRPVAVLTGDQEVHIVADVAWAACRYAAWTGDRSFLTGPGRPLVVDTARYWTGRAHWDGSGRAHLEGVIGPDEYHVGVSDNAFTNAMARWNLRAAAALDGPPADAEERDGWLRLAEAMVDGYDPVAGHHEQFTGFSALEPFDLGDFVGRPFAADVLLGPEEVGRVQVVKQADVIMLHHLVPEDLPPGSVQADLDRYLPMTCHGSSLSPAVHASVLARAGRAEEALELFRVAAQIDLDDLSLRTGAGVHLAGMGGLWQAYAQGFLGVVPTAAGLVVDPHLPARWRHAELGVRYRGTRVRVTVDDDRTTVLADQAVPVVVGGVTTLSRHVALLRSGTGWLIDEEARP